MGRFRELKELTMKSLHQLFTSTLFIITFIFSATINVPADYVTIQGGLDAASEGDTIQVEPGMYVENIFWPEINGIKLFGSGKETCVIDGDLLGSVIQIDHGTSFIVDSSTVISGFTLQNGNAYENDSGTQYISSGGGINLFASSIIMEDLIIINNSGSDGGGISLRFSYGSKCKNVIIKNNYAGNDGGGIYNSSSTDLLLENVTISENSAEDNGGGIWNINQDIIGDSLIITDNTSGSGGGGIYGSGGNIENSIISGNDARYGGGIRYSGGGGPLNLNNVLISNNSAYSDDYIYEGGGIYIGTIGNVNFTNVTITNNIANDGGGIFSASGANYNILNSILVENSPQEIYFYDYLDPCTVTVAFTDLYGGVDSIATNDNGTVYWNEGNIDESPLFCQPSQENYSLAENSPCAGTGQNGVNMGALDVGCTEQLFIEKEIISIPSVFTLHQNYPNPFNPTTVLQYNLPNDEFVNITIYDMLGNVINNLVHGNQNSGYKSVQWNATNNQGQQVSAGVYLYSIEAGDFRQTKKMILLK
tara:strand:- start:14 stop:1615 length:1602 start_codon:yes stop_codon:yes gene_type:complete